MFFNILHFYWVSHVWTVFYFFYIFLIVFFCASTCHTVTHLILIAVIVPVPHTVTARFWPLVLLVVFVLDFGLWLSYFWMVFWTLNVAFHCIIRRFRPEQLWLNYRWTCVWTFICSFVEWLTLILLHLEQAAPVSTRQTLFRAGCWFLQHLLCCLTVIIHHLKQQRRTRTGPVTVALSHLNLFVLRLMLSVTVPDATWTWTWRQPHKLNFNMPITPRTQWRWN